MVNGCQLVIRSIVEEYDRKGGRVKVIGTERQDEGFQCKSLIDVSSFGNRVRD